MITVEFNGLKEMVGFARELLGIIGQASNPVQDAPAQVAPVQLLPEKTTAVKATPAEQPDEPISDEPVYTLEEVRKTLAALSKAGKRADVQTIIKSFGVNKLTEIPKENYAEVMTKAGEL